MQRNIRKSIDRICKAARLPEGFRPLHGLRHVYASMLASSGEVDMYTLQKLLTHKSPQMTQRYAHLRDDVMKRAADLAGKIITAAATAKKEDDAAEPATDAGAEKNMNDKTNSSKMRGKIILSRTLPKML